MIIKVCGMREPENIAALEQLPIDMMGFIFYPSSARYVGGDPPIKTRAGIKRVGVFVNESEVKICEIALAFQLDVIQLHGEETPTLCNSLRKKGYKIIKALPVSSAADLKAAADFQDHVDYLLFDTRCDGFGGSGVQFDWTLLSNYQGPIPFLLSGGISAESAISLQAFDHPHMVGIDLNSKFEISPALKDIPALQSFIQKFKTTEMKNRINTLFEAKQKNILSVYYPAGFPLLEDTLPILTELQAAGINMVEIGIPFSDPMADGTVIQNASGQALRNGISLKKIFAQLESLRPNIHIPVILMGYLNPIMQYGFERFCQSCVHTGVDGMIIPDLPFGDYLAHYKGIAQAYQLNVIMLITPETSEERVRLIDQHTDGFIYMVSSASTTGAQQDFNQAKQDYFERVNRMGLKNPRLVGFGVSNKQTLDAANAHASGAIVGSKFVQLLESSATKKEAVQEILLLLGE